MNHRRGFTLIELLLVVAVLMIFMASAIFYMSPALRGVQLEEGAARFESLFKFASAEATQSGKRVLVRFVSTNDFSGRTVYLPRVAEEKDPTGAPGVFTDLEEASWMDVGIGELVSVISVLHEEEQEQSESDETQAPEDSLAQATEPEVEANSQSDSPNTQTNEVALKERENFVAILGDVRGEEEEVSSNTSTNSDSSDSPSDSLSTDSTEVRDILFYPDGSSETVEIHLISCDSEDLRTAAILLNGITGMIDRKIYTPNSETGEQEEVEEADDSEDTLEEPLPTEEDSSSTNTLRVTPL